jgi:hypothetical protein
MLLFLRTFLFVIWQLDASLTLPDLVRRCSAKVQPSAVERQKIRRIHAIWLSGKLPFSRDFAHAASGFSRLPPLADEFGWTVDDRETVPAGAGGSIAARLRPLRELSKRFATLDCVFAP